jgi:hypothetical protein
MFTIMLVAASLVTAIDPGDRTASTGASDLAAYQAAKAKVGHSADAHVKLALWCEAHGLTAERLRHLTLAVLWDPGNALARGLLGMVSYHGKWRRAVEVGSEMPHDPAARAVQQEYLQRRAATPDRADSQWKLAQWCEKNGLPDQARGHYGAVVRLDPRREGAWKKLGYERFGNRWARPEVIAAEKAEAKAQGLANRRWRPILESHRDGLSSKDPARRARAENALAEVTDPRAVPSIWELFATGSERSQLTAVQVFGQIDSPSASEAIAAMAVFSPYPLVRSRAIGTASRRDPRDFLDALLDLIHKPFKYKVVPLDGSTTEAGVFVEGERFNIQRLYEYTPLDPSRLLPRISSSSVPFNPFSTPALLQGLAGSSGAGMGVVTPSIPSVSAQQLAQTLAANPSQGVAAIARQAGPASQAGGAPSETSNLVAAVQIAAMRRDQLIAELLMQAQQQLSQAQQSLADDVKTVETWNAGIREVNERVLPVVTAVTGRDYGTDRDAWLSWWNNELGYVYQSPTNEPKPTYTQMVLVNPNPPIHSSCFAAGTQVQTIEGLRPIDKLQVGDRVLSQNTTNGTLSFQPIVAIHHNEPTATLSLRFEGETIVATGIHRFWKPGKGWVMARELKPGDVVRTVGGTARLEAVSAEKTQPVYNLDVAENRDFFVGRTGCLVYDFSFVQPVPEPFDSLPALSSPSVAAK